MNSNASATSNANLMNAINKTKMQKGNKGISSIHNDLLTNYTLKAISSCWNAFCSIIAQNYNLGKGTAIKGFGTFTFNNCEVNLIGTTNQFKRDNRQRTPVFIVSPEFLESLRPGQYAKSGLIYYNQKLSNGISHIKLNYAELAYSNGIPKDECAYIINNLFKHISQSISKGTFSNKELPCVGVLLLKNNIIGVKFDENLISEARSKPQKLNVFKKSIRIGMDLSSAKYTCAGDIVDPFGTAETLRPSNSVVTRLTRNADAYLKKAYDIDINNIPIHEHIDLSSAMMFKSQEEGKRGGGGEGGGAGGGKEIKFINDQRKPLKIYKDGKRLCDEEIPKEILQSIEYFKGVLISRMKRHDKNSTGKINVSDCVQILSSSKIHDGLNEDVAKTILDIYSNGFVEIDYMQFIARLIKDSRSILSNWESKLTIDTHSLATTTKELQYSKSCSSLPNLKVFSYQNNANIKRGSALNTSKSSIKSIHEQKKAIDSIKKQLSAIKILIPQLKIANKLRLDQNISINEFIHILSLFSISYSEETIKQILDFLQIRNRQSFTLNEFESQLNKIIVLDTSLSEEALESGFKRAKDVFYLKGGKGSLFRDSNEMTKESFISLLSRDMPGELAEGLYSYLVKTKRNFTIDDYSKHFEKDNAIHNEESKINLMRVLIRQMEKKHLRTDEYFDYLLTYNISTKQKSLSCADFIRAVQYDKIPLSAEEISILFRYIDTKGDDLIDRDEFVSKVNHILSPLSEIQYIIRKRSLDIEDISHRMQLVKGSNQRLTFDEFSKRIKMLDYTFNANFISGLFNSMKEKSDEAIVANSDTLLNSLNVYSQTISVNNSTNNNNSNKKDGIKIKNFSSHFESIVKETISYGNLKKGFEDRDFQSRGLLSQIDFCAILTQYIYKDFTDDDIIKYVRIHNLYADGKHIQIRYPEFLDLIYYDISSDKFSLLCEQLKTMVDKDFNGSIGELLMKINNKERALPITAEKLKEYINKRIKEDIPLKVYCKLDIDADGLISFEDLRCAVGRYAKSSFFKYKNNEESPGINIYPSETMDESKLKTLIKLLKQYIKSQSLSEIGLFKKIDKSNDGLISGIDFNDTIDSILPMAPAIKDQFFNYLDYYHNGVIDLETFISRLNDISGKSLLLPKNSNSIENTIINEFVKFIQRNSNLSETELFTLMDRDSDGIISNFDLKQFVIDSLLISACEFNDYQIERVMQRLSLSKNKIIGINDIAEFKNKSVGSKVEDYHLNTKEVFKVTTNQNICPIKENEDWINEVIERFAMFISEKYPSIKEFFDENTEKNQRKFTYADFIRFNANNADCFNNGFNLTKDELLSVYSSLDSQKKDYLLLEDLETKLQLFDYYKKMHIDIKSFFKHNFHSAIDAFKFVVDLKGESDEEKRKSVSKAGMFKALEYFFPKKYKTRVVLKYLDKYFKSDTVPFSTFSYVYFDSFAFDQRFLKAKNNSTKVLTSRTDLLRSHSQFKIKNDNLITPFDGDSLNKIRRLLESSRFDLKQYFDLAELKACNGVINKYQFRNMIKKLDLGITNLEIDAIIARSGKMNYEGLINLNDFIKYLKAKDQNLAQVKENVAFIIRNVKQLIYKYYSNPIICFHTNDSTVSKCIDFNSFKRIVNDLYTRDSRQCPNFTMLKNCFDALDLRKDGMISINEWTRAFGSYNGLLDLRGYKIDNGCDFYLTRSHSHSQSLINSNRRVLREWESSNDICEIYKLIAKNKKMIREFLLSFILNKSGTQIVQSDNLISVLKDLFPRIKISHTQWRMLVLIGKTEIENLIDLDSFFLLIDECVKKINSHPRKFLQ